MKRYCALFLFFSCSFLSSDLKGQVTMLTGEDLKTIQKCEDTLSTLARGILVSEIAENRMYACHQFIPSLVRALKVNHSFQYKFPRLENISIQYPADSTFRIFSWQLQVNFGEYRYFGAIQFNQALLKLIPLVDRSDLLSDATTLSTPADKWYGVVYYAIKPIVLANKEKAYLLFGYDGFKVNEHRKIIDVLSFKDGQAVFGLPIFKYDKTNYKSRVVYQYGADAAIRVNYDENEAMIVCDHLMANPNTSPENAQIMVPDGSYEGFKLEKGIWKYIAEVFPSGNAANQRAYTTKSTKQEEKKPSKSN